jgi:hypothetical protein
MRKLLATLGAFLILTLFGNAQTGGIKPYEIKSVSAGFDVSVLEKVNPQMMDIFRAKKEKSEVVVQYQGKTAVIVLEAAEVLELNRLPVDTDAVEKGTFMRPARPANQQNKYSWTITENFDIDDTTTY